MKRSLILIICLLAFGVTSCRSTALSRDALAPVSAEVIYRGTQCAGAEEGPSAEWILEAGHLSLVYSGLKRHVIGTSANTVPDIDFGSSALLMVFMGRMPSSGYAIDLADSSVDVTEGTADIRILWSEPAPGSAQAQVVTSPCMIIKLPRAGYDKVALTDLNGKVLLKQPHPVK